MALWTADLTAIKAKLSDIRDTELDALINPTNNKPRWSGDGVGAKSVTASARKATRLRYFGFHSRASFCASAICSGVILRATESRFFAASSRCSVSEVG